MRVAHVFRALNAGGIERWLTDLANDNAASKKFSIHFFTQSDEVGFFEQQLIDGAVEIHRYSLASGYMRYFWSLFRGLRKGRFDVVHSHVHHFSGFICLLAFFAGVKVRVSHSHNDKREAYSKVGVLRRFYFKLCRSLLVIFCNRRIAVSPEASASLFSKSRQPTNILPCGIAFEDIGFKLDKKPDSFTLGHVGSFTEQKNHRFLLDVIELLDNKYPGNFRLLMAGDGPLKKNMELYAEEKAIDCAKFLGVCSNIPELLAFEVDCFIMPSLHEGLSLALVEAQYYGCSVVASDKISGKHKLAAHFEFCRIDDVEAFSRRVCNLVQNRYTEKEQSEIRLRIKESPLSVGKNSSILESIYKDADYTYNFFASNQNNMTPTK